MKKSTFSFPLPLGLAVLFAVILLLVLFFTPQPVQPVLADALPVAKLQTGSNAICLGCHNKPGMTLKLANGDVVSLTVDSNAYGMGVHGAKNMSCTNCHVDITGFPHNAVTAQSAREFTLQYRETCKACHTDQYKQTADSMHTKALDAGNQNAASCADCHNPHTQPKLTGTDGKVLPATRAMIPQTCARCHSTIYQDYAQSVHGKGILENNNTDVATCTDCHGVHQISDPTKAAFRNSSIQMCAKCHTDAKLMDKYGLSTGVLNTYVSDFHGTTVTLFNKQSPDEPTNKPVCYDCHGIHNIVRPNDPVKGLQVKENLLLTCRKCHPDANLNFPSSWLSHYTPSAQKWPLVYYVNLVYMILIPLVIGAMLFFVLTDVYRKMRTHKPAAPVEVEPVSESKPEGKE